MVSKAFDLKAVLDDKFAAHEHRSSLAISELEGRIRELIHDQEKAQDKRHMETMTLLQTHSSELTAHDVRIKRVEDSSLALKAWSLTVLGALLVSALSSIFAALKH